MGKRRFLQKQIDEALERWANKAVAGKCRRLFVGAPTFNEYAARQIRTTRIFNASLHAQVK